MKSGELLQILSSMIVILYGGCATHEPPHKKNEVLALRIRIQTTFGTTMRKRKS
jgi:hypothetical protein